MALTDGVDASVAPGAIADFRRYMNDLWHALDGIHIAGDKLGNNTFWESAVAAEFRSKWATLSPVLMKAKSSTDEINGHLIEYNNNISRLVADNTNRTQG
jgi:hypothetical protein